MGGIILTNVCKGPKGLSILDRRPTGEQERNQPWKASKNRQKNRARVAGRSVLHNGCEIQLLHVGLQTYQVKINEDTQGYTDSYANYVLEISSSFFLSSRGPATSFAGTNTGWYKRNKM